MGYAFQTPKDSYERIIISGVGVLEPAAGNFIDIEEAAHELWELQDSEGRPLSGEDLKLAAERFASGRGFNVIEVKTVREQSISDLLQFSKESASAEEASRSSGRRRKTADEGSNEE